MKQRSGKAAGVLVAAVLGGIVGGLVTRMMERGVRPGLLPGNVRSYTEVVERGEPAAQGEAVVQVVQKVGPAVVNIDTLARSSRGGGFGFFDDPPNVQQGQGSGFIINGAEGLVVTNNHVVEGAERIQVTLSDKRRFTATVVGTDPLGDIGLIRITNGGKLPEVKFGDSDKLQIGQITVAIGNPLGLENTVTQGVLSQIGRRLNGNIQGMPLEDLIQTDAAINPGNSGGPLLDAYAHVIGMNTAIISKAQGIGFAVAANTIKRSVADLLEHGEVIRPWVGVTMEEMSPQAARQLGLSNPEQRGVLILAVREGEPAARGGLQRGDIITSANGQAVEGVEALRKVIRSLNPGDKLSLKGLRDGRGQTWQVTVGKMPPPADLGR